MTAFNVVRFNVKKGMEDKFLAAHGSIAQDWLGIRHANIIRIGDDSYCLIAEWESADALISARPAMIETLNSFRDTLDDLGSGLGVTDPVGGPVVLSLK